jgi:hypothetical protein
MTTDIEKDLDEFAKTTATDITVNSLWTIFKIICLNTIKTHVQTNGRQPDLVYHGATDPSNGCLGENTGPTKDIVDPAKKRTERDTGFCRSSPRSNARKPTIHMCPKWCKRTPRA